MVYSELERERKLNTNGFVDIMLSFHTAMGTETGQGQGTDGMGFQAILQLAW